MLRLLFALIALLTAGCTTTSPAVVPSGKRLALSFDDLPRAKGAFFTPDERTNRLVSGLRRAKIEQAVFFVTPGNLSKPDGAGGEERIARYVAAGHVIANHSFSHRHLTAVTETEYIQDIDRAEAWLKDRPGYRPWFRFPFLNEGRADTAKRDSVRAALQVRNLRNGYVTVDGADWNMETLTIDAVRSGKPMNMQALRELYVETMVQAAEFNDALARRALGRSPAHVLLLHETDLAALFINDLADELRKAGWTIITAEEAYSDPIHEAMPDVPSAQGTLTEAIAWEKGLPAPRWYERVSPRIANPIFERRVLGSAK